IRINVRAQAFEAGEVDTEVAKVAAVDANNIRACKLRAFHVEFAEGLDQSEQPEVLADAQHLAQCVVVEYGRDQQHAISTISQRLKQVEGLHQENHAHNRRVTNGSYITQVFQVTIEA